MRVVLVLIASLLIVPQAFAFPEMVRHGYVNCNSCHTNLVGGGLLNEYGRSLSRELLAQKTLTGIPSAEGDEKFAYGLVKTPSWLLLGSDIRLLQVFVESKEASRARFLIMQVELEASAQIREWVRVFASVGRVEAKTSDPTAKDFISSPTHGVEFVLTPADSANRITSRSGRFMPAYGIGFAEHTLATRRLLDFQPGQERYASEVAWLNDHFSAIGTAIFAQTDGNGIKTEKGGALQVATPVGEKSKFGVNYYQSQRNDGFGAYAKRMYGAFAYMGFTKQWYGLLEVDRVQGADQKWGVVDTFKLGYEIEQGLHLVGIQEFANLNLNESNPKFDAYSAGVEWFPRPHWDLYALYRRERDTRISPEFQDVIWLIGHFYL